MTVWVLSGWILMVAAVVAALSILFLLSSSRAGKHPSTETSAFSPRRYEPLRRLASGDDLQFLQSIPGCNSEISKRYCKAQRRVLGMYVQNLKHDFRSLHAQARLLLASREASPTDSQILWSMMRQRIEFERRIALLETRIALGGWGLSMPSVEPLLQLMDGLRFQLTEAGYSQAA